MEQARTVCTSCGGGGTVMCAYCGGRGYREVARNRLVPGWPPKTETITDRMPCPTCGRTGRKNCLTCDGKGHTVRYSCKQQVAPANPTYQQPIPAKPSYATAPPFGSATASGWAINRAPIPPSSPPIYTDITPGRWNIQSAGPITNQILSLEADLNSDSTCHGVLQFQIPGLGMGFPISMSGNWDYNGVSRLLHLRMGILQNPQVGLFANFASGMLTTWKAPIQHMFQDARYQITNGVGGQYTGLDQYGSPIQVARVG